LIKAYCDGASRGNPGPASCAYVIYQGNVEVDNGFRFLGKQTNNYAEYNGLIDVLSALSEFNIEGAEVFCDSKLVVNQVTDQWKAMHPDILPLYWKARGLYIQGGHTLIHIDGHSGILGNERADELCNECLDGID
jgi:ribonuclease HI